jgi:hypothetical protein
MAETILNKKLNVKKFIADKISEIIIPESFQFTAHKEKFLFHDPGAVDKKRFFIFTTESNLRLLEQEECWYVDGTFDISPTFFKQVYTIHIMIIQNDCRKHLNIYRGFCLFKLKLKFK